MAKGNMLLGHARGKVGDLVFSRQNGQQVTRARAAVVSNPQTTAQMVQRILMNTVAQAYSKMSPIVDHSFEGLKKGQPSMSYFIKTNLAKLRQEVANKQAQGLDFSGIGRFTQLKSNYYAPNEYVIAKGQLPEVGVDADFFGEKVATTIALSENATYADVIAAAGLQRGDQITFIGFVGEVTAPTFKFARVILDPHNEDGTPAELTTAFIADGAVNMPSPKNEGDLAVEIANGKLQFGFGIDCFSAAVIVSRKKADGTWMRSNATLSVAPSVGWIDGMGLQDCLDAILAGSIDTDNPLYLNNAGVSGNGGGSAPVEQTDRVITAVSVDGTALEAGAHSSSFPSHPTGNISGELTGNKSSQKIYAFYGAEALPTVGSEYTGDKVEMTINGTRFSGRINWGSGLDTIYCGFMVLEGTTVKQIWCSYEQA